MRTPKECAEFMIEQYSGDTPEVLVQDRIADASYEKDTERVKYWSSVHEKHNTQNCLDMVMLYDYTIIQH